MGESHRGNAFFLGNLAMVLVARGRHEEAEEHLLGALEMMKDRLGDQDERTRRMVARPVKLYDAWSKLEKASEYQALLGDVREDRSHKQ